MISQEEREQIRIYYSAGHPIRQTAAHFNRSIQKVFEFTKECRKYKTPIKDNNIINNIDTLLSNIDSNNKVLNTNNISTKDIKYLSTSTIDNKEKDITESNISNIEGNIENNIKGFNNNKYTNAPYIKLISKINKKLLNSLYAADYKNETIKNLSYASSLMLQRLKDLTTEGSAVTNNNMLIQIFDNPEEVKKLLKEIQDSKLNTGNYIADHKPITIEEANICLDNVENDSIDAELLEQIPV